MPPVTAPTVPTAPSLAPAPSQVSDPGHGDVPATSLGTPPLGGDLITEPPTQSSPCRLLGGAHTAQHKQHPRVSQPVAGDTGTPRWGHGSSTVRAAGLGCGGVPWHHGGEDGRTGGGTHWGWSCLGPAPCPRPTARPGVPCPHWGPGRAPPVPGCENPGGNVPEHPGNVPVTPVWTCGSRCGNGSPDKTRYRGASLYGTGQTHEGGAPEPLPSPAHTGVGARPPPRGAASFVLAPGPGGGGGARTGASPPPPPGLPRCPRSSRERSQGSGGGRGGEPPP